MAARCYSARKVRGWVVDRIWEEAETRRLALRVSVIGHDDALALCWAGHALVWICGEFSAGAALLDQALAVNPNLAVGWRLRGYVSLYLGQHETALEQIAHTARLNPLDPESLRSEGHMATALLLLGRYEEALQASAKALARFSAPTFGLSPTDDFANGVNEVIE